MVCTDQTQEIIQLFFFLVRKNIHLWDKPLLLAISLKVFHNVLSDEQDDFCKKPSIDDRNESEFFIKSLDIVDLLSNFEWNLDIFLIVLFDYT